MCVCVCVFVGGEGREREKRIMNMSGSAFHYSTFIKKFELDYLFCLSQVLVVKHTCTR